MEEVLGAPGVPQQRAYIEQVIGTIRRECLDHLIVFKPPLEAIRIGYQKWGTFSILKASGSF